ncbi:hypothetical protein ACHAXS_010677 [Conticribra weissflogii]
MKISFIEIDTAHDERNSARMAIPQKNWLLDCERCPSMVDGKTLTIEWNRIQIEGNLHFLYQDDISQKLNWYHSYDLDDQE